jgi:hypothetical protein
LLAIPEVAWLLGVDHSRVCRLIRVGLLPVVRRRSRVLVPAHALAHLADDTGLCQRLYTSGDVSAEGLDGIADVQQTTNPDCLALGCDWDWGPGLCGCGQWHTFRTCRRCRFSDDPVCAADEDHDDPAVTS